MQLTVIIKLNKNKHRYNSVVKIAVFHSETDEEEKGSDAVISW